VPRVAKPDTRRLPPLIVPSASVVPTVVEPPLNVVTVALVEITFVPPLTVPAFTEPACTNPPPKFEVNNPATVSEPSNIPIPLIRACDPNRVLPKPLSPASVIVPLFAVKYTLSAATFALLTAPNDNPLPLTVAVAAEPTVNVAKLL
jgi:hypothetical protein